MVSFLDVTAPEISPEHVRHVSHHAPSSQIAPGRRQDLRSASGSGVLREVEFAEMAFREITPSEGTFVWSAFKAETIPVLGQQMFHHERGE